jgi:5-methyltetrahydropteroyltriglutamate--homocysteine methyltransferase
MTTYRADHVGSLLRPKALLDARSAHAAGTLSADALRAAEDAAILDAIRLQREAGMPVVSDGEFRRFTWLGAMAESVEGFVPSSTILTWKGPGGGEEASTSHIVGGKLRQHRRLTAHESGFLRQHAGGPWKVTMPSPAVFQVASYQPAVSGKAYADRKALLADLVPIVRREVQALVAEGCPYIQLDDAFLSLYLDPDVRARWAAIGFDAEAELQHGIDAVNACLEGVERPGVTVGLHICRGNSKSRWFTTGGYDAIAEKLFSQLTVDRFLLEYDDERSGGFEPLRFVPRGKTVVLGLVTTKRPELETVESLKRAIDQAAQYLPLDALAISPQCGFGSVAAGNLLSVDDERRKLELVAEVARRVWG